VIAFRPPTEIPETGSANTFGRDGRHLQVILEIIFEVILQLYTV